VSINSDRGNTDDNEVGSSAEATSGEGGEWPGPVLSNVSRKAAATNSARTMAVHVLVPWYRLSIMVSTATAAALKDLVSKKSIMPTTPIPARFLRPLS
jgi:hypothetical protein